MAQLLRAKRRHGDRRAPGGRHAHQRDSRARRKQNDAVRVPRPAAALWPGPEFAARRHRDRAASARDRRRSRWSGCRATRTEPWRPRCPPAAAPSSPPATAATAGTPSPDATNTICRPSGERANEAGSSVAGVTMSRRVSGGGVSRRYRSAGMASATITSDGDGECRNPASRPRDVDDVAAAAVCGAAISNAPSSARRTSPMACTRCLGSFCKQRLIAGERGREAAAARSSPAARTLCQRVGHVLAGKPACRSASRKARSRTPRCRRACRQAFHAPARDSCRPPCRDHPGLCHGGRRNGRRLDGSAAIAPAARAPSRCRSRAPSPRRQDTASHSRASGRGARCRPRGPPRARGDRRAMLSAHRPGSLPREALRSVSPSSSSIDERRCYCSVPGRRSTDIRMIDASEGSGFALEAGHPIRVSSYGGPGAP